MSTKKPERILLDVSEIVKEAFEEVSRLRYFSVDLAILFTNVFDRIVDLQVQEPAMQELMDKIIQHHETELDPGPNNQRLEYYGLAFHDLKIIENTILKMGKHLMHLLMAFKLYDHEHVANYHIAEWPLKGFVVIDVYMDYELTPSPEFSSGLYTPEQMADDDSFRDHDMLWLTRVNRSIDVEMTPSVSLWQAPIRVG